MAVSWHINDFIVLTVAGYGGYDVKTTVKEIMASPAFREGLPVLIDRRTATDNPTSEELGARAHWISKLVPLGTRCAVVSGPLPLHYGLARILSAALHINGSEVEVFSDVAEARQWLMSPRAASA